MERLTQILRQITELATEAQSLSGGGSDPDLTYPRIVTIDGASLELHAPIAADWIPSMETRELTRYGSFGSEPSNGARFNQPLRSPAGYPMVYTPDGMGGFRGSWVNYNGVNFTDDAAVRAYQAAVKAQHRDTSPFSPGGPR